MRATWNIHSAQESTEMPNLNQKGHRDKDISYSHLNFVLGKHLSGNLTGQFECSPRSLQLGTHLGKK